MTTHQMAIDIQAHNRANF